MKKKIKKFFTGFFDLDGKNHISGYELFGIFMICNVLGYCIEMVYGYITNGYWESRQSLVIGPFGLAYGLGGILLSVFLYKDYNKKWWKIFLKSMLLGSIAEYIMSLGEELVFGHVSWDYSNIPLNLNGRICLLYSIYWGILGLVWVKIIYPLFIKFIHKIPIVLGKILFWALFIFMFFDTSSFGKLSIYLLILLSQIIFMQIILTNVKTTNIIINNNKLICGLVNF